MVISYCEGINKMKRKDVNNFIPHMSTIIIIIVTILLQSYVLHTINVLVNALSVIPLIGVIITALFAGLNSMWFFGTLILASIIGVLIEINAFSKDKNKYSKAGGAIIFVVLFSYLIELVL